MPKYFKPWTDIKYNNSSIHFFKLVSVHNHTKMYEIYSRQYYLISYLNNNKLPVFPLD